MYGYAGYGFPPQPRPAYFVPAAYPYPPPAMPMPMPPYPPVPGPGPVAEPQQPPGFQAYPAGAQTPYGVPIDVNTQEGSGKKKKKKKGQADVQQPQQPVTPSPPQDATPPRDSPALGKPGLYVPPGRRGGAPAAPAARTPPPTATRPGGKPPQMSEIGSATNSRHGTSGSSRDGGDLGDAESDAHSSDIASMHAVQLQQPWIPAGHPDHPVPPQPSPTKTVPRRPTQEPEAPQLVPTNSLISNSDRNLRHTLLGHLNRISDVRYASIRDALIEDMGHVDEHYELLVTLLFDGVVICPRYIPMYAKLCRDLCDRSGMLETSAEAEQRERFNASPFRVKLLFVCEQRYEQAIKFLADLEAMDAAEADTEDVREALHCAKQTMGFLAALFEQGVLGTSTWVSVILRTLHAEGMKALERGNKEAHHFEYLTTLLQASTSSMERRGTAAQKEEFVKMFDGLEAAMPQLCPRLRFLVQNMVDNAKKSTVPQATTPSAWVPSQ